MRVQETKMFYENCRKIKLSSKLQTKQKSAATVSQRRKWREETGLWCNMYRTKTAQNSMNMKTPHQFSNRAAVHGKGNSALKGKGEISEHNAAYCRARDGHRTTYLQGSETARTAKRKGHPRLASLQPVWSRIRYGLCLWWWNETSLVITGKLINLSYFRTAFSKDVLLCP